jgi:hypothetical protein
LPIREPLIIALFRGASTFVAAGAQLSEQGSEHRAEECHVPSLASEPALRLHCRTCSQT